MLDKACNAFLEAPPAFIPAAGPVGNLVVVLMMLQYVQVRKGLAAGRRWRQAQLAASSGADDVATSAGPRGAGSRPQVVAGLPGSLSIMLMILQQVAGSKGVGSRPQVTAASQWS